MIECGQTDRDKNGKDVHAVSELHELETASTRQLDTKTFEWKCYLVVVDDHTNRQAGYECAQCNENHPRRVGRQCEFSQKSIVEKVDEDTEDQCRNAL